MKPEEIVTAINQAYEQAINAVQELDTEKRAIIAQYIKELEEKKIAEIRQALASLPVTHNQS